MRFGLFRPTSAALSRFKRRTAALAPMGLNLQKAASLLLGAATAFALSACNPTSSTQIGQDFYPGIILSQSNSVATVSQSQVLSGDSVSVTVSLQDTNGNPFVSNLPTVILQTSGGMSTGSFSPVVNNGDSTYSATFTGITAGTATTITPIVNGSPLTSTLPSVTVLSGNFSLTQSTLSLSSSTDVVGLGVTATLTVRDSAGNAGSSGLTVLFSTSGGTSGGSFGATTDQGNGVYSSVFTGASAGSATSVGASIQGRSISTAKPLLTVIDSAPSLLTYSVNPAVFTKGQAITNDTPSNSGGPINSYSISPALPVGLTLNGGSGVISGTPTSLQSATSYTVTGTNTGGSTSATITITVNDAVPSALVYATNPAVYTRGSAIPNDTPSNTGGSITSYSISPSLPAGLGFSVMTGVISGTPTAISGSTTYTVTATNTGGSTTASLSLTVMDIAPTNLTYGTANAVYTKATAISSNSPTSAGGPIVSYSVSPSLPSGLALSTTSGVITGTPTAVSPATLYTVTATNSGGSITGSITLTVQDVAPASLVYATNPATFTKSSSASDSPSQSGGAITSYSVSPALPAGLSLNPSSGLISGTPSSFQAAATYIITASNSGGSTTASLSITINDVAPSSLTYSTNPAVYTKSSAITTDTPANSGGSVVSYAVSPGLPAGLNFNTSTGVVSGTPTGISATTSYTVTATNTGGSTTANLSITVNDIPPSTLTYATNPATYTLNQAISANTTTNAGGVITSYSVSPALPAGLTLNTSSGSVTGTPSVITSTATYIVTGVSSGGNVTASLILTINDAAPTGLTYSSTSAVYMKNSGITPNTVTNSGGAVTSYSVSPGLPSGLSLNTTSGVISGTPTAITASANYTVTALNTGGSATALLTIAVNDIAPSSLVYGTASPVYTKGLAITTDTPSSSGGPVVSYSISSALPTGLSFSTTTGVISGTATIVSAATNYTITATNTGGSTTATVNVTVNDVVPSNLVYSSDPATYTKGTSIGSNTPTSSGGAVTSYTISPSLPTGLSFNTSTGVMTGTPTVVSAASNYTITAINSGGSVTDSVSITVNDIAPSSFTYSTNPATYIKGTSITTNTPTVSGGAVTSYSVSPALPSGISLNTSSGVISGTPTAVTSTASYSVTALNSGGSVSVSVSITVNDVAPSSLTYTTSSPIYVKGTTIGSDNPSNSGGVVTSYAIAPALPAGLSLSTTTGVISGTPTAVSATTTYIVTATNSGGNTTASLSITVHDVPPSALTYFLNPAVYTKSSAIANNIPSNSGGTIVSYAVSPSLPAGLTLNSSTGVLSGTPTTITSAASYTVTATNSGGSTTASVSITVNDVAPSALSYSANPATYTNGYAIVNNTASYSGGAILSFSVSPALPAGLSLSVMSGTISGTPTAVVSTATYVVTATNSGGTTTANVSIAVGNPTIAVSANNNQTGAARSALTNSFVAIVKDASGAVIANQLVDWAVVSGGGSLSSAQNATTAGGLSSSKMTLGASAGSNTCTATIDGTTISVTFTATATTSPFTSTWTFNTSAPFAYNSSKIDFTNGYAELTPAHQTDNSNSCSIGFGDGVTASCGGSSTGTVFSSATDGLGSSNYMFLSHAGTATDLELDSTWTPAWSSLVGYWKLNELAGATSVADSSPVGTNSGTPSTGVTLGSTGKLNAAASFNGSANAGIVTNSTLEVGTGDFTLAAWIKSTQAAAANVYPIIVGKDSANVSTPRMAYELVQSNQTTNLPYISVGVAGTFYYATATKAINDGNWHHLVGVRAGTTLTIYLDGIFSASTTNAAISGNVANSANFNIGGDKNSQSQYNGSIDDVAVWSTALSASAVATIYQHESAAHAGTLTSRVMDGLSSNTWTTLAATTTLPFGKELPDTATVPSPTPISESQSSYSSQTANLLSGGPSASAGQLVGLWHLDEPTGTTSTGSVLDRSGQGNNGTPTTVTFGSQGKFGSAVLFSGTSYISFTNTSFPAGSTSRTFSVWINPTSLPASGGYACIMGYGTYATGTTQDFCLNNSAGTQRIVYGGDATDFILNYTVPINAWTHLVFTYNGTKAAIYVNGVLIGSANQTWNTNISGNPFTVGRFNGGNQFNGLVDEVGVWTRLLGDGTSGTSNEILELYRRGANRIRYQARSCPDSTCSTNPTWIGPDGSNQTYFSELNNNSVPKDGGDLTTSDSVNASSPAYTFGNFVTPSPSPSAVSVPANRYFQYRAVMESDDTGTSCNYGGSYTSTWCSPELQSVAVAPNHYDTSNPTIVNNTGVNFATLTSLLETLGTSGCGSGTLYNLSPDDTNWYYLNGSTWTLAGGTVATATAASSITPTALATFPSPGTIYFKVFLQSSGTSACTINSLAIGGTQ